MFRKMREAMIKQAMPYILEELKRSLMDMIVDLAIYTVIEYLQEKVLDKAIRKINEISERLGKAPVYEAEFSI